MKLRMEYALCEMVNELKLKPRASIEWPSYMIMIRTDCYKGFLSGLCVEKGRE